MLVLFNDVIIDASLIESVSEDASHYDGQDYKYLSVYFRTNPDSISITLHPDQSIKDFWSAISDHTHQIKLAEIQYQQMLLMTNRNQSLWSKLAEFIRNRKEYKEVSKRIEEDFKSYKKNIQLVD